MKILIVDDCPEIAYATRQMLGEKNNIKMDNIFVIHASSDGPSYEEAQNQVLEHYKSDSGCIVLMDYNLGFNREKNGGAFIQNLIEKGMSLENFIGVSSSFNGCQKVPGLHCDFGLRGGDMSIKTMERLGLLAREEFKLPTVSPELPDMLV